MSLRAAVRLTWREGESGFMFRMVTHAYCRSSGLQNGRDPIETDDAGVARRECCSHAGMQVTCKPYAICHATSTYMAPFRCSLTGRCTGG